MPEIAPHLLADAQNAVTDLARRNPTLGQRAGKALVDLIATGNPNELNLIVAMIPAVAAAQKDPAARAAIAKDGQALADYAAAAKGKPAHGILNTSISDSVQAAGEVIKNPIAAFFQAHIWLRVAEVALGVVLVAVGVAKLTNAIPAATKVAKTISRVPI